MKYNKQRGEFIRHRRAQLKLSQDKLADKLNIDRSYISKW